MIIRLLFISCLSSSAFAEVTGPKDGDPQLSVVRATPHSTEQLQLVRTLYKESLANGLDFWRAPTSEGEFADVMIQTERLPWLVEQFNNTGIEYIVTVKDVQKLIIDRETPKKKPLESLLGSFAKRFHDGFATRNRAKFRFGEYQGYGEMVRWMNEISQQYPHIARVLSIGTTHEGRNIVGLKISRDPSRNDKRVIWIDGGIHAREWGAIHTALYFIEQLIANYDIDPQLRRYVDDLTIYIVPVLNPDGFEYTRSDVTPMKRLWRKNRAGIVCKKDQWFRDRCCGGVDLNRNFDFHWGEAGSSNDLCSEIYAGTGPFSELESRAVRDFLLSPELYGKVDSFITLHTYSQMWIHPYNHAKKSVPVDINDLEVVGRRAVSALESVFGTKYRFGTGADILYPSSGGSDDWAKAKGGAKYVYLVELRPGEDVWDGFVLDTRQLIPMGRETFEGMKVVFQAVLDRSQAASTGFARPAAVNRRPVTTPSPFRRVTAASSTCRDTSPWCRAWLRGNPEVCRVSSIYMSRDCAATCRFC